MSYRRWSIFVILLFCIAGWWSIQYHSEEKMISKAAGADFEEVDKIIFHDGSGLHKPFALANQTKISQFTNLLDGYLVKREKEHEDSKGWIHKAVLYDGEEQLCEIIFKETMEINGKEYEVVAGEELDGQITTFINSINQDRAKK